MSCKECEHSPKTYEEYCIGQRNPSIYCPDAYTEKSHLCNNYGKEDTPQESKEEIMELVIKIPEKVYEIAKQGKWKWPADDVYNAIKNGTLLTKGHERLFDEKEIDTVVNGVFNVFDTYSPETFLNVIHNQCIEAVVADRSESEDEV